MKGFKNTTRTQYSMGGDVYAKGGMAKGAAKISKVMGEFKKGELHSGSKDGPKVTKPAQAKAIAMSEARKAGMKAPMKKNEGGKVGKMPPLGESVKSANRMSKMTAAERLAMEARFGEKKRPSPADSAKSANRISAQEAAEARHLGVFNEGGKVRKYAEGGKVRKYAEGGVNVSEENPERLARDAARKAASRAAMATKKAEIKRIFAEERPKINAARAALEAAAERNAAQYGGLSQAAISSALNQAMYAQGASEEARRAAMQNLTTGAQKAPRDIRGNTDIGSIMQIVSQYATPDQLNAGLKVFGRRGMFNPFDTYNTGVSDATKNLNDLIAARDARAGVRIKKPVTPMTPPITGVRPPMQPPVPLPTPPMTELPRGVGAAPGVGAAAGARGQMSKPSFNASAAYRDFGGELKGMIDSGQLTLEQANALKAPAFEATRLRDVGQQQQAMDAALAAARERMAPPKTAKGTPPPVVAPTRQVIGYRSPPPGMSAADLANYDTRIYAQPEMPADFGRLPPGVPGFEQQYAQPPMQPSSGGYLGTNMTKSQLRQTLRTPPTLFGTPAPFTPPVPPPMVPPAQAPAAMPGAPQTDPRFRMGGMAKRRPC